MDGKGLSRVCVIDFELGTVVYEEAPSAITDYFASNPSLMHISIQTFLG
jgi:hypothetical protein